MKNIGEYRSPLSKKQISYFVDLARAGDQRSREILIESFIPLACRLISGFNDDDSFISRGLYELVIQVDNFISSGLEAKKLQSYLHTRIRYGLIDEKQTTIVASGSTGRRKGVIVEPLHADLCREKKITRTDIKQSFEYVCRDELEMKILQDHVAGYTQKEIAERVELSLHATQILIRTLQIRLIAYWRD